MTRKDNGIWHLRFAQYTLNEPTVKAISCVLPWLVNVDEIDFTNNQI